MERDEPLTAGTSLLLFEQFRGGDDRAAEVLFTRYFERLTRLARSLLSPRLARRTDPEDVILSAYRSFFVAARAGRFTLARGGDLWRLLASITRHKLLRQARHHTADRRSVDREISLNPGEEASFLGHWQDPSPDEVVALTDELEWLFAHLDPSGRRVLELRLQGAELSAIAADTGRSERTVRRILDQIRQLMAGRRDDG